MIKGTRQESDLSRAELANLQSAIDGHCDAVAKYTVESDGPERYIDEDLDFSRSPVEFDRYWVEHMWLILQEQRARLGLDWEPAKTSERTADGKVLEHGLRVFTNDLEKGWVDLTRAHWSNARGGVKSLWFDVVLDDGRGTALQNAERVVTRFRGEDA